MAYESPLRPDSGRKVSVASVALGQKQTSTLCSGRIAASQRADAHETAMTTIALPLKWFIGIGKLDRSTKPINDTLGFRQIERALCPEDRTNDGVGPA